MHVYLNGWNRDHGTKTIIKDDLEDCKVSEGRLMTHHFDKGALHIKNDDGGKVVCVTYGRGINLSANGQYHLQISFTPKDIVMLAYLCLKEISVDGFSRLFGAMSARKEAIENARRVLRLGYSSKDAA